MHSDEIVKEQQWGVQLPRIPGHEIVGTVVAIPPTEKKWKTGQRVGGGWHGGALTTILRPSFYFLINTPPIKAIVTSVRIAAPVTTLSAIKRISTVGISIARGNAFELMHSFLQVSTVTVDTPSTLLSELRQLQPYPRAWTQLRPPRCCAPVSQHSVRSRSLERLFSQAYASIDSLRHMDVHPGDVVAVQGIGYAAVYLDCGSHPSYACALR